MDTILTNARIVLADQVVEGSLHLRDGKIAGIDSGVSSLPAAEDMGGDYVIPGLIELHTDHLENHYAPRPKVRWNPIAAVCAHDAQIATSGITTVFDALRVGLDEDTDITDADMRRLADAIEAGMAKDRLRADHFIHLRCEVSAPNCLESFEVFENDPLVRIASLMDHSPGQRQFVDLAQYALYYQKKHNVSDAELQAMIVSTKANQEKYADLHRRTLAEACRQRGIPTAAHDDATLAHVEESADLGIVISEFPTTMEAAEAARERGMTTIMGAPNVVRGGSHSGNIAAHALAEEGLLDALSSDYVPISMLHAAFKLHDRHGLTLPDAVATVSRNPARMLKLDDRGEIEAGKRADLVRVTQHQGLPLVRQVWREGDRIA